MAIHDSLFSRLIAPFEPDPFLYDYWEQKPLYVAGGVRASNKLDLLRFDLAAFKRAAGRIQEQHRRPDYGMPALTAYHSDARGSRSEPISADQIDSAYNAGVSASLAGIQLLDPRIAFVAARLQRELSHPGNIHFHAFLSPDRHGAATHFDRSSLMVLQLEGAKRWRFSKTPCMDTPPDQGNLKGISMFRSAYPWATINPPASEDMEERVLQPGDVLYLPAGCWHEVAADKRSLAITIGFDRMPLHTVVARMLERALTERTPWRRTPPPLHVAGHSQAMLDQFMANCADRLADLRATVMSLTPEDLAMAAYPGILSISDGESLTGEPLSADDRDSSTQGLKPDDQLVVSDDLRCEPGLDAAGGYTLLVSSPYATASIGIEAFGLVERMIEKRSFKAAEISSWSDGLESFSWEQTRDALDALVANGLLGKASAKGHGF